MRDMAAEINEPLAREAPALFQALSPLGRRIFFPPDIPAQAAEAKGKGIKRDDRPDYGWPGRRRPSVGAGVSL